MIKRSNITFLLLLFIFTLPNSSAFSLTKLSKTDMKKTVAQSGVSIFVSEAIIYNSEDSITFTNAEETNSYDSYLKLTNITALTNTSIGTSDVDGDNHYGHLKVDVGKILFEPSGIVTDRAYFSMVTEDMDMDMDMTINNVNYCETDIGSLNIEEFNVTSFHIYMGAHADDTAGIDAEFGLATRTELFEFQYNDSPTLPDTGKLALQGVTLAEKFDPSTGEASGEFKIGDIENGKPFKIDIIGGNPGAINEDAHFFFQTGAIEGSLRVENVNFGGNDVGQIIMEGINISKFDVEFPGRGLGDRP